MPAQFLEMYMQNKLPTEDPYIGGLEQGGGNPIASTLEWPQF